MEYNSTSTMMIQAYNCDGTSYDCMFGTCLTCGKIELDPGSNEDAVDYCQWQVTKKDRIKGEKKVVKIY